jgi:hypothetical protein
MSESISDIITVGDISYLPDVQAIIADAGSRDMLTDPTDAFVMGSHRIVPWGEDNNLPHNIMEKVKKSEVVGSNLDHNIKMMYGQGVKPFIRKIVDNKEVFEICTDERVLKFYEENDISGYFLEQCADMAAFYNAFPEVVLTKDMKSVYSLSHKEASFSRWGEADKKTGQIIKHFYSADWYDGKASEANTAVSDVLNYHNPLRDLRNRIEKRSVSVKRFILQVNYPTPGRLYYQRPYWWSIFESGSYDYSTMIWHFKKALMKNGLAVRWILYVSDKYWDLIFQEEKIDRSNPEAVTNRKQAEFTKWREFLGNSSENAGKGMLAIKKLIPSAGTAIEEKYIVFEPVPSTLKGGEFLEDSSEVSNTISYGMQVHPSLVGPNPGKSTGSMSGTDKRELYHIKSAMMAPYRDRLLRPLYLVKAFNNFPADLVWKVVDYNFTTLDENKQGKEKSVQSDKTSE